MLMVGSRWQQTKGIPDFPLHSNVSQLLLGDLEVFPGVSSQLDVVGEPPKGSAR